MRAQRLTPVLVAALLAVSLTACGGSGTPTPRPAGDDPGLRGRAFLSTAVTVNGQARPLVASTRVRLQFTGDGRLLAEAGCNSMSGPVRLTGGRIEVSELATTGIGCEPAAQDQDRWLADFLAGKPSWRLDGANLVVSSGGTEIALLDRTVAEPDLALDGTRWTVESILSGDVASSTPAGTLASLVFDKDTVRVDTGCNQGSGGYHLSGNRIRFDRVATTKKACELDRAALENAVVTVLDGEVGYTVDGDVLTLKADSGKGLTLRGQR